jgi:hypothetical protein
MENKYLDHVLVMLNQVQTKVEENFGHLSEAQLNWKPNESTWSIAECLDHLIVTTKLYYGVFEDLKNNRLKTNFWMKLPFWTGFIGRSLLKAVDPETKKKIKTSPPFEPTNSNFTKAIITDFVKTQRQLVVYINELDGYDHSKIIIASPVNSMFVYRITDAFAILWKHQIRHFNQAKALMSKNEFPTA